MAQAPYCLTQDLPATVKGDTWDGLSWSVDSDETEFSAALASARFQLQDSDGNAVMTLTSATAGQVTIVDATPGKWSVTVEPRTLSITAGVYSYGLELTDSDGIAKTRLRGTLEITDDPVI